jgi:hypothetical protein
VIFDTFQIGFYIGWRKCIFSLIGFWLSMWGLLSGSSIVFHSFLYQFLCRHHTIFVNIPLHYNLYWGVVIPSASLLLVSISLTIWVCCAFIPYWRHCLISNISFGTFLKNKVDATVWDYFWVFYYIGLCLFLTMWFLLLWLCGII